MIAKFQKPNNHVYNQTAKLDTSQPIKVSEQVSMAVHSTGRDARIDRERLKLEMDRKKSMLDFVPPTT